MQYKYDANGRMVWSATVAGASESKAVYDGMGQRVATQVGGTWRYMVYDAGGKLIAEYGGAESSGAGGVTYMLSDHQGSVRAVMNQNGWVAGRYDYQPFGEAVSAGVGLRTMEQGFNSDDTTRQKYGMTERDEATGLDHTAWRKYEQNAGRWTTPDPLKGSRGNPQSFNRFSYVQNDPVNKVDPSGLTERLVIPGFWDASHGWGEAGGNMWNQQWSRPDRRYYQGGMTGRETIQEALNDFWEQLQFDNESTWVGKTPSDGPYDPCGNNVQMPASGFGYILKSGTSRSTQYGTIPTLVSFVALAKSWYDMGGGRRSWFAGDGPMLSPLRVGELGITSGKQFGEHKGQDHKSGTAVDVGLFWMDGGNHGGDTNDPGFDVATTQQFLNLLDNNPLVVDYYLQSDKVTGTKLKQAAGHRDHIHINFQPCR